MRAGSVAAAVIWWCTRVVHWWCTRVVHWWCTRVVRWWCTGGALVVHCATGSSLGGSSWTGASTGWGYIMKTPTFKTLRKYYDASICVMYYFSFM